jgi:NACHT domain
MPSDLHSISYVYNAVGIQSSVPEPAHSRFPTLTLLLNLSGWAALAISNHSKLISTPAAAIGGVLWTAFVGITSKIWARAEKTVVELAGDALDIHIRDFASRYRRRYLQHLQDRHRTFDVKGLSTQGIYALEIEQVYVELTVDPKHADKASPDPISKPIPTGRHDIWTLFSSPQMQRQNFAILGAPGSGKTTLLKHITMGLAANRGKFRGLRLMPVLLFIRDLAQAIGAKPSLTLADLADEAASKMGIQAPGGWFGREFRRGRCLVMLDGLDEVADATLRKTVAEWVESQIQALGANRFLVTSRPFGYRSNPLAHVTVLEVRPFSSEQSERFINNWYLANEVMSAQKNDEGVRIAAREGAADLLKRIRAKPALTELAVNPLLLTMIANIHRYRSSLPGRRVELYNEICEVFLGKRQQARGMELDMTPAQKKCVLQPLAFQMMCAARREITIAEAVPTISGPLALVNPKISPEEFLRIVENSSGLLLEREIGVYGFAHLTFQEFLAASHIVEVQLEDELTIRVAIPWWHEVIRLYVALSDATRIVEACIAENEPAVAKLTLAVECLEEARAVRPDLRTTVESIVNDNLEHLDPERARLAAETKLALRLRRFTQIDDDHSVDNDLISCAEYQLFIDDRRAAGDYRQPDHWSETHFPAGSAREPVLGIRSSDAQEFCCWLSARHEGEWIYQIPDKDLRDQPFGKAGYWAKAPSGPDLCGSSGTLIQPTIEMLRARHLADIEKFRAANVVHRGSALHQDLARAVDLARTRNREAVHTLDYRRARARALALDRALDIDFDIDSALARAVDGNIDLNRDHARDSALASACDRARYLALDLDLAVDRIIAFELESAKLGKIAFRKVLWWRSRLLRTPFKASPIYLAAVEDLLDVFLSLAILEERIEGKLPAFEGIRIMKVRKAATSTRTNLAKTAALSVTEHPAGHSSPSRFW